MKEDQIDMESKINLWKRRTTVNSIYYFGLLAVFAILNIMFRLDMFNIQPSYEEAFEADLVENDTKTEKFEFSCENSSEPIACDIFGNGSLGIGFQFSLCHTQLMVIVGLCLDGGRSVATKFFNTKTMQFFGRISMSLYLVHEPIIFYIRFLFYGVWLWKDNQGSPNAPTWTIPIHIIVSLLFATLITLFIEEPARKLLKNRKAKDTKSQELEIKP